MEHSTDNPTPERPILERAFDAVVEFFSKFVEVDPNIGEADLRAQGLAQARQDHQIDTSKQ